MKVRREIDPEFEARLAAAGLLDLPAVMDRQDLDPVKCVLADRQVHRLSLPDGEGLYLKRHSRIRGPEGFASRLGREWRALRRARAAGVACPRPLALLEETHLGRVRRALLITEGLALGATLESRVASGVPAERLRRWAEIVARQLAALHRAGINHRDFYAGHLFVAADDDDAIWLLDFDRADCRDLVPWRWRIKDLAALALSLPDRAVGLRLRLRFLRFYLGESLRGHRRLVAMIDRRVRRTRARIRRKIAAGAPNLHLSE